MNRKKTLEWTFITLFTLVTIGIIAFRNKPVEAVDSLHTIDSSDDPAHSMIYILGEEEDYTKITLAAEQRRTYQSHVVYEEQKQIQAEKEKAEKEKVEKEKKIQVAEAKKVKEAEKIKQVKDVTPADSASSPKSPEAVETSTQENSKQTPAEPQETPAPKETPVNKPEEIGSQKIGINGQYKSYVNYGRATTEQLQSGIDAGYIVAGITSFNGNDGETTYFGGHNPGVMSYMASQIHTGAVITVTDGEGEPHRYQMIEKADVDMYGEGMLYSLGRQVIDVYAHGTGTESILIQFCNTNNPLMSFWYGVKI